MGEQVKCRVCGKMVNLSGAWEDVYFGGPPYFCEVCGQEQKRLADSGDPRALPAFPKQEGIA